MTRQSAGPHTNEPDCDDEQARTLPLTEVQVLSSLGDGAITEEGLLPYSSNHSFLVLVDDGELTLPAVYKPQRGENPLWDFEWGTLCKRETAAYLLSTLLGWDLVPPTVLRSGTRGLGSVQFYVDNDSDAQYFTVQSDARYSFSFRQLALFDYMINNADRKSGHCLVGTDERIWAIDHGICFHHEFKLRTVIWEFSGQSIEQTYLADIEQGRCQLIEQQTEIAAKFTELLSQDEYSALIERMVDLLRTKVYPSPSPVRRNYPWPPILRLDTKGKTS